MESKHKNDDKVSFHLSKAELEAQTRNIHEESAGAVSPCTQEASGSERKSGQSRIFKSPSTSERISKLDGWTFESLGGFFIPTEDVRRMSPDRQEKLLIREVIYACSGVPSSYIRPELNMDEITKISARDIGCVHFRVNEYFSCALRALLNELLPLISYYINVQCFIEETNMTPKIGRGRQALSNSLQDYMNIYYEQQASLETELQEGKLTLQKLVQSLRPTLLVMEAFAKLTMTVRHQKLNTAQLLSLMDKLYKEHSDVPELGKQLEQQLLNVSKCYIKMVQIWTQKGIIYDPQRDFFIEDMERKNGMSSTLLSPEQCCFGYWQKRYRLRIERLPTFLVPHMEIILNAGKYLNVLRQCNVSMKLLQLPLCYTPNDNGLVELLEQSYQLPAHKLLQELLEQQQLMEHLENVRSYFLLQQREFVDAFIAKSEEQLQRNVDRIIPTKLESLLCELLQSSSDPHKQLLHCQLMSSDLATQLAKYAGQQSDYSTLAATDNSSSNELATDSSTDSSIEPPEILNMYGYEAFTLSYEARWPVGLLLHDSAIAKLQLLHRMLFFLRYLQHQLERLWQPQAETVIQTTHSCVLRQRMLSSMLALSQYMMDDIIEPRWQQLQLALANAQNIDEVQTHFQQFLDDTLILCLLAKAATFVRAIYTLGHVCLNYCSFMKAPPYGTDYMLFELNVGEYEQEFGSFMQSIMELLREIVKSNDHAPCQQLLRRLEEVNEDLDAQTPEALSQF